MTEIIMTNGGFVRVVIDGEPCSKANSRKITVNPKTGKKEVVKSAKARAYEQYAAYALRPLPELLVGPLVMTAALYYASEQPDLDESLILDVLQRKVYKNDRQVREKHIFHAIDKARPRAEILIQPKVVW